ncbi:MAG: 50S ribosomal protein L24 [Elusimicrobia bacterium HGW-Elusimicrobia-2]|nr:MAG: 50S ribosomal protein L24 [Elusimicrobia bacterium HGW-Elusimicrobia-2]
MMKKLKNKDKVMMMKGKYKGKISEVIKVFPSTDKALVAKVAMVKRHTKPTQNAPGGIQEKERPVSCSALKLICPHCNEPSRVGFKNLKDGKARFCKKCGEII